MAGNSLRRESDDLAIRINELGTKSTQLVVPAVTTALNHANG
jgi:hypothetical protein